MTGASPFSWFELAALCAQDGPRLPPPPAFSEALRGDRDRQLAELGYTFWNQELLTGLARRLQGLQVELVPTRSLHPPASPAPATAPFRWVELAAGTGRWAAELSRRGLTVAATDNFAQEAALGNRRAIEYGAWVGRLSAHEAVDRLRPEGVLCAWPPLGSGLVFDLLQRGGDGSEALRVVVCIGEPGGASELPEHTDLLPPGWEIRRWPECERHLVGFNDPPPGPGWRTYSQLLVYVRTQQRSHTGNPGGAAELEE